MIVGKGLHSKDGNRKIAPALQKYAERMGLKYEFNNPHEGCIKVNIIGKIVNEIHLDEKELDDRSFC